MSIRLWLMHTKMARKRSFEREARRQLKQANFVAEQQFLNGTGNEGDGFTGLADALDALEDAMVLNAGGTTANTGSSVYLIRTDDDGMDTAAVTNGNIEIKETHSSTAQDANGKEFDSYRTPIMGWLGLQTGSAVSIARVANVTDDAGKGCTDELIYRALELFPAAKMPNLIVMSRRSRRQLRESRVATTDGFKQVSLPTEVEGIQIVITDALNNSESLIAAA